MPSDKSAYSKNAAGFTAVNHRFEFLCRVNIPVLETDADPCAAVFQCKESLLLFTADCRRFFHKDMDTTAVCFFSHWNMQIMGRTDVQYIDLFIVQHLFQRIIGVQLVLFSHCRSSFGPYIRAGNQFHVRQIIQYCGVNGSDSTAADDSCF